MQQLIQAVQKKAPSAWVWTHNIPSCRTTSNKRAVPKAKRYWNSTARSSTRRRTSQDVSRKLQIACYEALGLDGMKAFAKTPNMPEAAAT